MQKSVFDGPDKNKLSKLSSVKNYSEPWRGGVIAFGREFINLFNWLPFTVQRGSDAG